MHVTKRLDPRSSSNVRERRMPRHLTVCHSRPTAGDVPPDAAGVYGPCSTPAPNNSSSSSCITVPVIDAPRCLSGAPAHDPALRRPPPRVMVTCAPSRNRLPGAVDEHSLRCLTRRHVAYAGDEANVTRREELRCRNRQADRRLLQGRRESPPRSTAGHGSQSE